MPKKQAKKQAKKQEPVKVIVRTYSAGVHYGTLERQSEDGKRVRLVNAKRIWRWEDAWTLNEVATAGVGKGSKIGAAVPWIELTEAIEVIGCTPAAVASLESASWAA